MRFYLVLHLSPQTLQSGIGTIAAVILETKLSGLSLKDKGGGDKGGTKIKI
jgi:hypothetical protein